MTATKMKSMRRWLAITLVGTSLIVAACGSDKGSTEPAATGAGATGSTGAAIPVPPVEAQGTSGKGESARSGSSNGVTPSSGDSGSGSQGTGGSRGKRGSRGESRSRGPSPGSRNGGSPTRAGEPPSVTSDAAASKLAKEICANVTLEGIALNLRISLEQRDANFVAKAYSRSYPAAHRDAAYKGCLEGFRNPAGR
jgi:hypothetical protein